MDLHTPQSLFLGVDVGTQGTKAVVYDPATQAVVGRGAQEYGLLPSPATARGRAEQDPATWTDAVGRACRRALADAGTDAASRVAGLGVSGQQHGMVCLDDRRDVVRPAKLWCDTESAAEAAELSSQLGW